MWTAYGGNVFLMIVIFHRHNMCVNDCFISFRRDVNLARTPRWDLKVARHRSCWHACPRNVHYNYFTFRTGEIDFCFVRGRMHWKTTKRVRERPKYAMTYRSVCRWDTVWSERIFSCVRSRVRGSKRHWYSSGSSRPSITRDPIPDSITTQVVVTVGRHLIGFLGRLEQSVVNWPAGTLCLHPFFRFDFGGISRGLSPYDRGKGPYRCSPTE